jgi:hypothetical protein
MKDDGFQPVSAGSLLCPSTFATECLLLSYKDIIQAGGLPSQAARIALSSARREDGQDWNWQEWDNAAKSNLPPGL